MPTAETLTIREPDDWHLHLRDDAMLALTADYSARQFARAIIMPNLVPPVTTVAAAEAYRERILNALPTGRRFTPLMTAYLTDEISVAITGTANDGELTDEDAATNFLALGIHRGDEP